MSRKKTPQERGLSGYYRPSRHGPKITPLFPTRPEPAACPLPRQPPAYLQLNKEQAARWRTAAGQAPWLQASDAMLVALWCVHTDRFDTAMAARNRAEDEGDHDAAAAYGKLLNQTGAMVIKLARLLGFTPRARQRLGISP